MTASSENWRVGRGRPPIATRWKKGQSGNPKKQREKRPETALATIDRLLLRSIQLSINGEPKKQPALAAIVLQLLRKVMAGNVRAYRALLKYQQFASQNMEKKLSLEFLENDYTRAFSSLDSSQNEK